MSLKADQGLWSANAIKAQYFLYELSRTHYNCIVGSSLSFELVKEELPSNYFNLSFRGQSVSDGLRILRYKDNLPDTLFIESNFISKGLNKDFVDKIANNAFETSSKSHLPVLWEKYKPLGILTNWMEHITANKLGFIKYHYRESLLKLNKQDKVGADTPELFGQLVQDQKKYLATRPDQENWEKVFNEVQHEIYHLKEKGVKVIFFEMPVHYELQNARLFKETEKEIYKRFPTRDYPFLKAGNCEDYETTDGIHLKNKSAVEFTRLIVKNIRRI